VGNGVGGNGRFLISSGIALGRLGEAFGLSVGLGGGFLGGGGRRDGVGATFGAVGAGDDGGGGKRGGAVNDGGEGRFLDFNVEF